MGSGYDVFWTGSEPKEDLLIAYPSIVYQDSNSIEERKLQPEFVYLKPHEINQIWIYSEIESGIDIAKTEKNPSEGVEAGDVLVFEKENDLMKEE